MCLTKKLENYRNTTNVHEKLEKSWTKKKTKSWKRDVWFCEMFYYFFVLKWNPILWGMGWNFFHEKWKRWTTSDHITHLVFQLLMKTSLVFYSVPTFLIKRTLIFKEMGFLELIGLHSPFSISVSRFILIKRSLLGQDLEVEVAMPPLLCGQQINSVVVLPLKKNFKNGLVRSVRMFPSFFLVELPIVLVEVRYVFRLSKRIVPHSHCPPYLH